MSKPSCQPTSHHSGVHVTYTDIGKLSLKLLSSQRDTLIPESTSVLSTALENTHYCISKKEYFSKIQIKHHLGRICDISLSYNFFIVMLEKQFILPK